MNESTVPSGTTSTGIITDSSKNNTNSTSSLANFPQEVSTSAESLFPKGTIDTQQQPQDNSNKQQQQQTFATSIENSDPAFRENYSSKRDDTRPQNTAQKEQQNEQQKALQGQGQQNNGQMLYQNQGYYLNQQPRQELLMNNNQFEQKNIETENRQQFNGSLINNSYYTEAQQNTLHHQNNFSNGHPSSTTPFQGQQFPQPSYGFYPEPCPDQIPFNYSDLNKIPQILTQNYQQIQTPNIPISRYAIPQNAEHKRSKISPHFSKTFLYDDIFVLINDVPLVFRRYIQAIISPIPIGITMLYTLYCKAKSDIEYPPGYFNVKANDVYIFNGINGDKYIKYVKQRRLSQLKRLNQSAENTNNQSHFRRTLSQKGSTGDIYLTKTAMLSKGRYRVCGSTDYKSCQCHYRTHRIEVDELSKFIVNPTWNIGKTYYVHGYGCFSLMKNGHKDLDAPKLTCLIVNVDGHLFAVQTKLVAGLNFFYEIPKEQLYGFRSNEIMYDCRNEYESLFEDTPKPENFNPETILSKCGARQFPQLPKDFVLWLGNVSKESDQSLKSLGERNLAESSIIEAIPQLSTTKSSASMISPFSHPVPPFSRSQEIEKEQEEAQERAQYGIQKLQQLLQTEGNNTNSINHTSLQHQPELQTQNQHEHSINNTLFSEEDQNYTMEPAFEETLPERQETTRDCFHTNTMDIESKNIESVPFECELNDLHQTETNCTTTKNIYQHEHFRNPKNHHNCAEIMSENNSIRNYSEEYENKITSTCGTEEKQALSAETFSGVQDESYDLPQNETLSNEQHQEQLPRLSTDINRIHNIDSSKLPISFSSVAILQRKVFLSIQKQHKQQQTLSRIQQRLQKRVQLQCQIKKLRSFASKILQQVQEQVLQFDNM